MAEEEKRKQGFSEFDWMIMLIATLAVGMLIGSELNAMDMNTKLMPDKFCDAYWNISTCHPENWTNYTKDLLSYSLNKTQNFTGCD